MDRNGDPVAPVEEEETDENASEKQGFPSSQDSEKWKLEQEFHLREKELEIREKARAEEKAKELALKTQLEEVVLKTQLELEKERAREKAEQEKKTNGIKTKRNGISNTDETIRISFSK